MQTKEELLQYLKNNYKNPGNALYHAGINKINFFFKGKVPINDIEDFLQRNHSYTVFKNTRRGPLNPFYKRFKREQFQIDLLELRNISKDNKGTNLLLTIIDSYTKFAWAVPLRNKQKSTVLEAFKSVISKLDEKPLNIISDLGTISPFFSHLSHAKMVFRKGKESYPLPPRLHPS